MVILHSMSLEDGEAVEKNWIEGSSFGKNDAYEANYSNRHEPRD